MLDLLPSIVDLPPLPPHLNTLNDTHAVFLRTKTDPNSMCFEWFALSNQDPNCFLIPQFFETNPHSVHVSDGLRIYGFGSDSIYTNEEMPPMTILRKHPYSYCRSDNVYIFGGNVVGDIWAEKFDINSNSWIPLPALPQNLLDYLVISIDTMVGFVNLPDHLLDLLEVHTSLQYFEQLSDNFGDTFKNIAIKDHTFVGNFVFFHSGSLSPQIFLNDREQGRFWGISLRIGCVFVGKSISMDGLLLFVWEIEDGNGLYVLDYYKPFSKPSLVTGISDPSICLPSMYRDGHDFYRPKTEMVVLGDSILGVLWGKSSPVKEEEFTIELFLSKFRISRLDDEVSATLLASSRYFVKAFELCTCLAIFPRPETATLMNDEEDLGMLSVIGEAKIKDLSSQAAEQFGAPNLSNTIAKPEPTVVAEDDVYEACVEPKDIE